MLTEHVADWTLIRDLWAEASVEVTDPMDAIERALEARGSTLADVFAEFAWRNVVWAYADGDAYGANLVDVPVELRAQGNRFAEVHTGRGSQGWDRVPSALLPASMGSNLVRWEEPRGDEVFARIRADRIEIFRAMVVVESGGQFEVVPLEHRNDELELIFPLAGDEDALTLVVATLDRREGPDIRFEYDYVFGNEGPSGDASSDSGFEGNVACGCSSPWRRFSPIGVALVLLTVLRVRRP